MVNIIQRKRISLANIPLLIIIIIFLLSGIIYRHKDLFWSEMIGNGPRLIYDGIALFVTLYAISTIVGIFRMREWGRVFGLGLYSLVSFMFLGIKLFAVFISPMIFNYAPTYSILWREPNWYPEYMAGLYCLVMIVFLSQKEIKLQFDKHDY